MQDWAHNVLLQVSGEKTFYLHPPHTPPAMLCHIEPTCFTPEVGATCVHEDGAAFAHGGGGGRKRKQGEGTQAGSAQETRKRKHAEERAQAGAGRGFRLIGDPSSTLPVSCTNANVNDWSAGGRVYLREGDMLFIPSNW